MKKLILPGIALMALVHNEILSLRVLCVFAFAGVAAIFKAMADHDINL